MCKEADGVSESVQGSLRDLGKTAIPMMAGESAWVFAASEQTFHPTTEYAHSLLIIPVHISMWFLILNECKLMDI